jgi:hypothetical protein
MNFNQFEQLNVYEIFTSSRCPCISLVLFMMSVHSEVDGVHLGLNWLIFLPLVEFSSDPRESGPKSFENKAIL